MYLVGPWAGERYVGCWARLYIDLRVGLATDAEGEDVGLARGGAEVRGQVIPVGRRTAVAQAQTKTATVSKAGGAALFCRGEVIELVTSMRKFGERGYRLLIISLANRADFPNENSCLDFELFKGERDISSTVDTTTDICFRDI